MNYRPFFRTRSSQNSGSRPHQRARRTGGLFTLLLAAVLATGTPAFAKNKNKHATQPPRHDGRTVIARLSSNEIVTESPGSRKTYKITDDTEFFYLGRKVTASDLHKGMRVVVTPEFDGLSAGKVEASDAPVADKNSKKK